MADSILKLKLEIEYLQKGIVPLGMAGAPVNHDINLILKTLPPQEARAMRRKFRKLWRSIVRRSARHGGKKGRRAMRETGLCSEHVPKRAEKTCRKARVQTEIFNKVFSRTSQRIF